MNTIKLLVTDIDGTIIPYGKDRISPKLHDAFVKAKENGCQILIATGRNYYFMQPTLFSDLDPDYVVTINGSCLVDKDGKLIQGFYIDDAIVEELTRRCDAKNIGLGIKFQNAIVAYSHCQQFKDGYLGNKDYGDFFFENDKNNPYHLTHEKAMGFFLIGEEDAIEQLKDEMPEVIFAWSFTNGYDAYPRGFSKAMSVDFVLEKLNLTWDNVMAFGDAENDIEMISKAKIGVAMGDAKEIVLGYADFVTKTALDDGVAYALEHFNII